MRLVYVCLSGGGNKDGLERMGFIGASRTSFRMVEYWNNQWKLMEM